MSFSDTQLKAMAITPKVTAGLSIPGSLFIISQALADSRRGRGSTVMQRALVGMSVIDVLSSIAWFLSSWMAPKGSFVYAVGNSATCEAQGFLLQIAIGAPLYNGALVLYYLLVIKYQWKQAQLARLERYLTMAIWIWSLGTAFVVLALGNLQFVGPICWIGDPVECYDDDDDDPPASAHCGRGKILATAFFCAPLWICILLTIYALVVIYRTVQETAARLEKYNLRGSSVEIHKRGRSSKDVQQVATRAVLYSIAFVITWTASTIWSVAQFFHYYPFWSSYWWTIMEPLQGFWNCLIFCYNRPDSRAKVQRFLHHVTCHLVPYPTYEPESSRCSSYSRSSSRFLGKKTHNKHTSSTDRVSGEVSDRVDTSERGEDRPVEDEGVADERVIEEEAVIEEEDTKGPDGLPLSDA